MKNIRYNPSLFLVLYCVVWFCSCDGPPSETKVVDEESKMITEDFHAEFTGTYTYVGPDTLASKKCSDSLYIWRAIVDCEGTANTMGKVDVHFDFCGDQDGNYGNTDAFMVDENNDTLFITCAGQVIQGKMEGHPELVTSYWKDEFKILGGTGKYEGATGKGMTDDYNSSEDPNSHHTWKGTITLNEGG